MQLSGEAKWKVPGYGDRGGGEEGAHHHHHHHYHQDHHHHDHDHRYHHHHHYKKSQGSQYVLSAPPLKSTKKLVREVKRILTGKVNDCDYGDYDLDDVDDDFDDVDDDYDDDFDDGVTICVNFFLVGAMLIVVIEHRITYLMS